jgi:hypothetical protein
MKISVNAVVDVDADARCFGTREGQADAAPIRALPVFSKSF